VSPDDTHFAAGRLDLSQFVGNVDVSRAFRVGGLPGPLNVAMGAEYRRESYQIHAGEPDSYRDGGAPNQFGGPAAIGAQVFPGFRPSNETDKSRNSIAGYVDVEGNVLAWLRLGGAVRTEHYSDFGGTIDGKFTTRVAINPRLVLRGSVSTGFRAPSLGQSFFSSTATNSVNLGQGLVLVESLTLPVDSAPAQVLGAQPLKPEHSLNTGAGFALTPIADLSITVDAYRIAIDDRIVLSGNFTAPPIAVLLAPFGANSARFFTNAIDTRTNGVDVTANHRITLGAGGELQLYAGYNNTLTELVGTIATPPQLVEYASVLFDRIEQRRLECGQPRDNVRLGGAWVGRSLGASINAARFGEFCSFTLNPADDQDFSPKWLTDVEVSYRVSGYLLGVGAQNLFDVFPDRNTAVNSFNGIQTFPSHSPFGMNGRVLYVRLGRTF
jgi:iron complex outermembrane receptor protein